MATMVISALLLVLFAASTSLALGGDYYSNSQTVAKPATMKKTHLHFFVHNILSGKNPSSIPVATRKGTVLGDGNVIPFGTIYVSDNPITTGLDPNSKLIGNARGMFASVSRGSDRTLFISADYEFTSGRFNGSSIAVASRDHVALVKEVGVVGGRGMFRMAKGFIIMKTVFANVTTGDAIFEYNATIFH